MLTSAIYLVQADAEGAESGRWPLLSPWLHSSALPVFAVLAVLCALVWGAVRDWLADYEQYAQETVARALRLVWQRTVQVPRPSLELADSAAAPLRAGFREPAASSAARVARGQLRGPVRHPSGRRHDMTQYATELPRTRVRRSMRALAVLSLAPMTMLAGVAWAFLQPWRVTLLHPHGRASGGSSSSRRCS